MEYIAKGPSRDDDRAQGWPAFQHETKMQRLFSKDKMIRPMVDFLPTSSDAGGDGGEPMMVLESFEQTLWDARNARRMTAAEIKWIMAGVLLGLQTIHRRGLVHTGLFPQTRYLSSSQVSAANGHLADLHIEQDLKMENVGLSGFDNEKPNLDTREIIVRMADCGSSKQADPAIMKYH